MHLALRQYRFQAVNPGGGHPRFLNVQIAEAAELLQTFESFVGDLRLAENQGFEIGHVGDVLHSVVIRLRCAEPQ